MQAHEKLAEFEAYLERLKVHDWTFEFSDDHRAWNAGKAAAAKLQADSKNKPHLRKAYWAFTNHRLSTDSAIQANDELLHQELNNIRQGLAREAVQELIAPPAEHQLAA